jgi:hypothetical protein
MAFVHIDRLKIEHITEEFKDLVDLNSVFQGWSKIRACVSSPIDHRKTFRSLFNPVRVTLPVLYLVERVSEENEVYIEVYLWWFFR